MVPADGSVESGNASGEGVAARCRKFRISLSFCGAEQSFVPGVAEALAAGGARPAEPDAPPPGRAQGQGFPASSGTGSSMADRVGRWGWPAPRPLIQITLAPRLPGLHSLLAPARG